MPHTPLPRLLTVTAAFALVGGLAWAQSAGTETQTETETQPAAEQTSEAPAITDPTIGTVLATVDETPITLGEVIAVRQALPDQYQQLPDEVLITALVQQLSDQQLLANAGHAAGLSDLASVRLSLRNQKRAVMADAFMAKELLTRVDEATIQATYEERYVNAPAIQEVRAAHILVETEQKANELKAQMDAGADFAALAAEHGTDGTASRGGDLGFFVKDQMVPEFAEAAFAMEPGTISDPVQTAFGWHLIKLDEKRDRPVPPLEAVEGDLVTELTQAAQEAILTELRDAAKVETRFDDVAAEAVRNDTLIAD